MHVIKHVVVSLLILCLGGFACGKKQTVTHIAVYTALEPEEEVALKREFETAHPEIALDVTRASTGIVTGKLLAEAGNPQADVVWGIAATSLLNADKIGLLAPYTPAGADQLSPEFRDSRSVPHWVGIDGYMTAFAVNTVEMTKANLPTPKSYSDLIKPIYHGLISMPNPTQSGTGFLTVSGILQIMHEDAGWAYLDALDKNVVAYTDSGSTPAEFAGTGEHPIGISFDFRILKEMKKGVPLAIVFPTEGSGWEMEANALIQKANIKPEAKVFLDWALGPTAFKYYGDNYGIAGIPSYAHPPEGFPADPQKQMIKNNFAWSADNRDRILAEWKKRYGGKAEGK
jgi:iron(III) transport system substrate-binding protein